MSSGNASDCEKESQTSAELEVDEHKERSRVLFNKLAFGHDLAGDNVDGKSPVSKQKSSEVTRSEWENIVDIVENWDQPDETEQKEFRKRHGSNGYSIVKNHEVRVVTRADGSKVKKLYRKGKLRIPQDEVFDAIYDAHSSVGHMKVAPTYNELKKTYNNITEKQVSTFINNCCFVCLSDKPTIKAQQFRYGVSDERIDQITQQLLAIGSELFSYDECFHEVAGQAEHLALAVRAAQRAAKSTKRSGERQSSFAGDRPEKVQRGFL